MRQYAIAEDSDRLGKVLNMFVAQARNILEHGEAVMWARAQQAVSPGCCSVERCFEVRMGERQHAAGIELPKGTDPCGGTGFTLRDR